MKRFISILLSSRPPYAYQNALKNFFSSSPILHSVVTQRRDHPNSLYRRISPVVDPDISIVPVLDQWVQEGRKVEKEELQRIISELEQYKRFKHALQISHWMTDKRYIPPSVDDIAKRMSLIHEVHGIEKVEDFFNHLSQKLKVSEVYITLLRCYAQAKSVEKAEMILQKLQDMGCLNKTLPYNILMNLYSQVKDWEKLDTLMHEMEEKGINADKYTCCIRMSAYAAASNIEGVDMIMTRIESEPQVFMDCDTYVIAAKAYLKLGSVGKVLGVLNKIEALMGTQMHKRKSQLLNYVLRTYAELGEKDDLYRIWNIYRKEKCFNMNYISMIRSLLMIGDIEGAEKIFEEWESSGLSYDFRIPNLLIDSYVKHGDLEKAEALLNRDLAKGHKPSFKTWYCLVGGYIEGSQVLKAVEILKKAANQVSFLSEQPFKDKLVTCLDFLERRRDAEGAEEFIKLLEEESIFPAAVCERLLGFIKDENSKS